MIGQLTENLSTVTNLLCNLSRRNVSSKHLLVLALRMKGYAVFSISYHFEILLAFVVLNGQNRHRLDPSELLMTISYCFQSTLDKPFNLFHFFAICLNPSNNHIKLPPFISLSMLELCFYTRISAFHDTFLYVPVSLSQTQMLYSYTPLALCCLFGGRLVLVISFHWQPEK